MYLTQMRPNDLQEAVKNNYPLIMGSGVIEYHGPHLPIGTDVLIADYLCRQIEQQYPCVVAPPISYGPTLSWAGGAEEGEMDFAPEPLFQYAKEMLKRFLLMGFKRIYIIQHHQGAEGLQSLCLKRAAAELRREEVLAWGSGWGRADAAAWRNPDIFESITVASIDSYLSYPDEQAPRMPIGHAGKGETQLIMHINPQSVQMHRLADFEETLPAWLQDATDASPEDGKFWLDLCVQGWVNALAARDS